MNRLLFPFNINHWVQGEPILSEIDRQRVHQPTPKEASPFAGLLALSLAVHAAMIFALIFLKPLSLTGTGGSESEISVEIVSEDGQKPSQGTPDGKASGNDSAAQDNAGSRAAVKPAAQAADSKSEGGSSQRN